jgi:hypothetical protein
LDVVALLSDLPAERLARRLVGTIVAGNVKGNDDDAPGAPEPASASRRRHKGPDSLDDGAPASMLDDFRRNERRFAVACSGWPLPA